MQNCKSVGLKGKKIYVHVFGCRTSLCEGEYIAGSLMAGGADILESLNEDDTINAAVIITCSVTQEADVKCRKLIRRARRILGHEGVLAVCGCWSQNVNESTARELGIDILAGNRGKNILPEIIENMLNDSRDFIDMRTQINSWEWEELAINYPVMHSRAFIKIQDGCNHFCTYCIIPFLRGRPVSRPEKNIIAEIQRLIHNGINEIILTGIHLGIYGHDINSSLADLIHEISKIHELRRLRLGSLEPFCLDDKLLDALSECESFCHHLHLPLQSGDDEILASMRRGYTAHEFVKVCDNARSVLGDDLHISSDILVGFPGESDNAFIHTLDTMRAAKFGRVHVFPYSMREGTIAASMTNQIHHDVKINRTSQAISLGHELYDDYVNQFVNSDAEVLIESNGRGYTRHYIEAVCTGNDNEIVNAKVKGASNGRLACIRRD
ncbi:MAG: MiaB/RimO family radical SAM methylthiotransferase [Synergistaceae bacterium]|nr:MiaB/RimO family radical SAM methylthiotransferase [Synergistaceae bacterium]